MRDADGCVCRSHSALGRTSITIQFDLSRNIDGAARDGLSLRDHSKNRATRRLNNVTGIHQFAAPTRPVIGEAM